MNLRGEVVGIGAAVLAPGGERQGTGVVIPANSARSVLDDLVAGRKVARGYLGITLQDLAPDAAEAIEPTKRWFEEGFGITFNEEEREVNVLSLRPARP